MKKVEQREHVVLIHGIWMTGLMMRRLGGRLSAAGYSVHYFNYHSVNATPIVNARKLARFIRGVGAQRLHLVAHSLGGVVLLHLYHHFHDLPPGRVVLLGSPVRGSGVAKKMSERPWMAPILGRSVDCGLLGGVPAWKGERELGSIVGTHNIGIGRLIGGLGDSGDGTVAVAETELAGAADTTQVEVGHTAMLFSPTVAAEVISFLNKGHFLKRP
ncbi:MAG: alpha/beta hydrolase [Candidatus Sedimenticola sp. (ex Thyasira tokunagai)]